MFDKSDLSPRNRAESGHSPADFAGAHGRSLTSLAINCRSKCGRARSMWSSADDAGGDPGLGLGISRRQRRRAGQAAKLARNQPAGDISQELWESASRLLL